ncbi:helix-turn-helix domain-containing protein [Actinacidiphila rubida]|uniref:Nitroimidazol reductase NimA, pyridoxamine 5'-phosphate oxidase superfamily n=1 Tax=Actinacidiphila rubida TaxID=310780 RepID=A0A1H8JC21_9ACTN|nr:pyridoxamine 5'-phosphate oxidase family protein [Actinacidiphila rubida]SEN78249.1 Nitroimidazol reductase NimA, pyridoxamine 5'-phosphate oxidase superfamily [Actinacidiphila rubida]
MDGPESSTAHPESRETAGRVSGRLKQLGLSKEELAREAGMSPCYLDQVLNAAPDFDPSALARIAGALGLPYHRLFEDRHDQPPGQTAAGERPVLARLTEAECWDRLGTHGVGRVVLASSSGPGAFPVNYAVDAKTVLYRTVPQGPAAPADGAVVSFEADSIDDRLSRGWSVLVTGTAERIDDPEAADHLARMHALEPWAGGSRPLWVRISPTQVTGRHITTMPVS